MLIMASQFQDGINFMKFDIFLKAVFFRFAFLAAQLEKLAATVENMALNVKGITAQQVSFE